MGKSFSVSSIILLCAALLQTAVLSNITSLPALPDVSLLCVLFFSIHNGRLLGEGCGFVSGLLLDFLSAGPFGINCLFRTLIGYVGGLFTKSINTKGFFVPFLLGLIATLIKGGMLWLISVLYPSSVPYYSLISWTFLFEIVFNAFLCPFMFKFLSLFKTSVLLSPETID